jgi:SOS response regulatory protein OraA/RecX
MPTVTALQVERRDRVRVELDGKPWRTIPAAAVVAAGLCVGSPLDRERARTLRRALRRAAALEAAARALARRDRSEAELAAQLALQGVDPDDRVEAVEGMRSLGYVDDGRFARSRGRALAERGYGDEAIRWDLEARGLDRGLIDEAVGALDPEPVRATVAAGRLGGGPSAARKLAAKGFSAESIEAAVGTGD